jgi:hypothetical protein
MWITQVDNMAATRAGHPCYVITCPLPATEALFAGKWTVTFWFDTELNDIYVH